MLQRQADGGMGQHSSLPAKNGLDHLLLEGRFSVDRRRRQLTFEWPLSTIRCWVPMGCSAGMAAAVHARTPKHQH